MKSNPDSQAKTLNERFHDLIKTIHPKLNNKRFREEVMSSVSAFFDNEFDRIPANEKQTPKENLASKAREIKDQLDLFSLSLICIIFDQAPKIIPMIEGGANKNDESGKIVKEAKKNKDKKLPKIFRGAYDYIKGFIDSRDLEQIVENSDDLIQRELMRMESIRKDIIQQDLVQKEAIQKELIEKGITQRESIVATITKEHIYEEWIDVMIKKLDSVGLNYDSFGHEDVRIFKKSEGSTSEVGNNRNDIKSGLQKIWPSVLDFEESWGRVTAVEKGEKIKINPKKLIEEISSKIDLSISDAMIDERIDQIVERTIERRIEQMTMKEFMKNEEFAKERRDEIDDVYSKINDSSFQDQNQICMREPTTPKEFIVDFAKKDFFLPNKSKSENIDDAVRKIEILDRISAMINHGDEIGDILRMVKSLNKGRENGAGNSASKSYNLFGDNFLKTSNNIMPIHKKLDELDYRKHGNSRSEGESFYGDNPGNRSAVLPYVDFKNDLSRSVNLRRADYPTVPEGLFDSKSIEDEKSSELNEIPSTKTIPEKGVVRIARNKAEQNLHNLDR